MTGDAHGTHGESRGSGPVRVPAPRRETDFVAPLTVGRPRWQRRYRNGALAVDAAALACVPVLTLLWRDVIALPLVVAAAAAGALAATGRGALRGWLRHLRRRGRAMSTVLAVGGDDDVAALVTRTRCDPGLGWQVRGACTSTGAGPAGAPMIAGVPVVGDLDTVASTALAGHYDAVAVAPTAGWTAIRLQQLAWDLDCSRTALLVDPNLVTSASRDMQMTEVEGLPLLRLDHPTLGRLPQLAKDATDRLGALVALVLVAPVLISCAMVVRRDGGPALRRRTRLGRGGREFALLTFRTTVAGTRALTPVGRVLRRSRLEALPQLLNVLGGSMALVGPRPSAPGQVSSLDRPAQRRLLVKPGVTGLRPSTEKPGPVMDELARQELRYAERWSPALDARILLRSVSAVLRRGTPR